MNQLAPKVNILLSTFNGVKFLSEQIESLLKQDYPNITIYIRDDGSTDGTVNLLRSYQAKYPNIKLAEGKNLSFVGSFFELARNCGSENEFYAFCDQDDVWNSHKVSRAIEMIQKSPEPAMTLYISRMNMVDGELKPHII